VQKLDLNPLTPHFNSALIVLPLKNLEIVKGVSLKEVGLSHSEFEERSFEKIAWKTGMGWRPSPSQSSPTGIAAVPVALAAAQPKHTPSWLLQSLTHTYLQATIVFFIFEMGVLLCCTGWP
jgi:hypothetical protein